MTNCKTAKTIISSSKGRKVEVNFDGGHISSNGGAILLEEIDNRFDQTRRIAATLIDPRRQKSCTHSQLDLVRQRIYGLALGYVNLNDHADVV